MRHYDIIQTNVTTGDILSIRNLTENK